MAEQDRALLRRDAAQLLWIGFHGTAMSAPLAECVAGGAVTEPGAPVGAVVVFRRNLRPPGAVGDGEHLGGPGRSREPVDLAALVALNRGLREAVAAVESSPSGPAAPLWIAVDQEGGRVQRVREPATVWPAMHALAGLADADAVALAEQVGLAMGTELAALEFDIDFAPVCDVHSNPANPIIGDRAFAEEPEAAAQRALALARGLDRAGVLACAKHFPGHGDTAVDSHLALPRLDHPLERLESVELLPFRRAAAAGMPLVMTAHVVFAALDDGLPATLSRRVITGLLRDSLGYGGLIVSDDLDMAAIAEHHGMGEAAVRAVLAGCDVLLSCQGHVERQREVFEALVRAAESRSEVRARIAQSAARIRAAKQRHSAGWAGRDRPELALCGNPAHRQLAEKLARAAGPPATAG
ncbi:MAG: beta-N-acetylhexosaminidase [Myxococcota bacterium]